MKIAISSTGKNLDSDIDERFGRCPYFLIAEIEDKKLISSKFIGNTASAQSGGAGISAAEIVANEKVDVVITVNLGPRAFQVFSQFGIKIYQGHGKLKNIINDFINGKLKEIKSATGPQHMGFG